MRVAFIAVNYNNCRISANYCASIQAMRKSEDIVVDIILVDNASKDEDFDYLSREVADYENVMLVKSQSNTGYFGGLNFGLSYLDKSKYDYIIVGNNDLFFDRDFLVLLSEKSYSNKDTVIVPDVETITGIHQNPQYINPPSERRIMGMDLYYSCYVASILINLIWGSRRKARRNSRKKRFDHSVEIFLCTGALMILTPLFFQHCEKLDDSLFLWGEEAALAHQLDVAKDRMLYDPDLHVTHLENASVSMIANYRSYCLHKRSYKKYRNYLKPQNFELH